jgi:hypothetical protein
MNHRKSKAATVARGIGIVLAGLCITFAIHAALGMPSPIASIEEMEIGGMSITVIRN